MGIRRGEITTKIVSDGLVFNMDAANRASYPKTGTIISNTIDTSQTGSFSGASGTNNTPQFNSSNLGILDFDGTDDFIQILPSTTLQSDYTIECWFKLDVATGGIGLVLWADAQSSGRRRALIVYNAQGVSTPRLRCSTNGYNSYGATELGTGTWFCGAVTLSSTGANQVYLNGIADGTQADVTLVTQTATPTFYLGRSLYGEYLNGQIANVKIYNRQLSAEEVLQNYNGLRGRFGV